VRYDPGGDDNSDAHEDPDQTAIALIIGAHDDLIHVSCKSGHYDESDVHGDEPENS
jgi:hypothetical protein